MYLEDFMFPIVERPVYAHNGYHGFIDTENIATYLKGDYKAIVREDSNELISVVKDSYQLVPNKELIESFLEEVDQFGTPYLIDDKHSFIQNNRMRLKVIFPDIKLQDDESDIPLAIYLHNSYDMSEGVRIMYGALKLVCANGMVIGKLLGKHYHRHTKGFDLSMLKGDFQRVVDQIPALQDRIRTLDLVSKAQYADPKELQKVVGKTMTENAMQMPSETAWDLYNILTFLISHHIAAQHRARYQMAVSRYFRL